MTNNGRQVVSDWTAAWQAKDPDKMAQYVSDDIKFRLDPSEPTMRTGRQTFLCAEWLDVALGIDITTLRNGPPPAAQGCD